MHRILFTVMYSHMKLLPMTALEGKIMIDCVQCEASSESRSEMEGKLDFKYSTG